MSCPPRARRSPYFLWIIYGEGCDSVIGAGPLGSNVDCPRAWRRKKIFIEHISAGKSLDNGGSDRADARRLICEGYDHIFYVRSGFLQRVLCGYKKFAALIRLLGKRKRNSLARGRTRETEMGSERGRGDNEQRRNGEDCNADRHFTRKVNPSQAKTRGICVPSFLLIASMIFGSQYN